MYSVQLYARDRAKLARQVTKLAAGLMPATHAGDLRGSMMGADSGEKPAGLDAMEAAQVLKMQAATKDGYLKKIGGYNCTRAQLRAARTGSPHAPMLKYPPCPLPTLAAPLTPSSSTCIRRGRRVQEKLEDSVVSACR